MQPIDRLAALWWGWMGPMLLQASLLIVVVGLVDLLIRRWVWPQVREALWLMVLVKLLLPPTWSLPTAIMPQLERQMTAWVALPWSNIVQPQVGVPSASAPQASPTAAGTPQDPGSAAPALSANAAGAAATAAAPRALAWLRWAFALWVLGALAFVGLLTARVAALRRWHDRDRRGQTIPPWYHELLVQTAQRLRVGQLPAIVFSDRLSTPAVCGILHPVLYLPRDYTENLSEEEAEHVLMHEMAHLKRGDLWLHALGLFVQVVYWFNPLVALARRQAQHVREICTDLTVAHVLRERTGSYRQTLLSTARRLLTESAAPGIGLLGVFEEPFRLVSRLRWLEKPMWQRDRQARGAAAVIAAAMLVFVLPMAGGALPGRDSANTQATPAHGAATGAPLARGEATKRALYVRNATRRDKCFLRIRYDSETLDVSELWLGDRSIAVREGGRTMIVNLVDSTLTYVSHRQQSYVVAALPLDLQAVLTPEVWAHRRANVTTGRVQDLGKTSKVHGYPCREFRVESWPIGAGDTVPTSFDVWACNEVGVGLGPFRTYLECLRLLFARDAVYSRELLKIDGLQLRLQREFGRFPFTTQIVDEVVEIESREPPPGVDAPPAGYVQQRQISQL